MYINNVKEAETEYNNFGVDYWKHKRKTMQKFLQTSIIP